MTFREKYKIRINILKFLNSIDGSIEEEELAQEVKKNSVKISIVDIRPEINFLVRIDVLFSHPELYFIASSANKIEEDMKDFIEKHQSIDIRNSKTMIEGKAQDCNSIHKRTFIKIDDDFIGAMHPFKEFGKQLENNRINWKYHRKLLSFRFLNITMVSFWVKAILWILLGVFILSILTYVIPYIIPYVVFVLTNFGLDITPSGLTNNIVTTMMFIPFVAIIQKFF
ncbi:hypothetical protein LCGC14_1371710 [marine sediment metagenome]|uniref:Uncharacterized protein n=1 Tax=marine sediment metagenome TaxID=412755 RepID=A0A0F9K5D5_9ZZZZ